MNTLAIILIGLLLIFLYIIINVYRKYVKMKNEYTRSVEEIKSQNEYILAFSVMVSNAYRNMKEIDSKGYFEADDYVGKSFKYILNVTKTLDAYKLTKDAIEEKK